MFEIGQRVVCIEGAVDIRGSKLIEGNTYIVQGITECNCTHNIYVGLCADPDSRTLCTKCFHSVGDRGEWWHRANRFVDLQEWEEAQERVDTLVNEVFNCKKV